MVIILISIQHKLSQATNILSCPTHDGLDDNIIILSCVDLIKNRHIYVFKLLKQSYFRFVCAMTTFKITILEKMYCETSMLLLLLYLFIYFYLI